jgi:hypothetical protein
MPRLLVALPACLSAACLSAALGDGRGIVIADEQGDDFNVDSLLDDGDEQEDGDKPKKRRPKREKAFWEENTTSYIDEIIPVLQSDMKEAATQVRFALALFKERQRAMDEAKREATRAMKELRQEAEKRRRSAGSRRMAKEKERRAKEESIRLAKEAMIKKAQALMGSKGVENEGILNSMSLGILMDVLMALPEAVENPVFNKRLNKAKDQAVTSVQDFLNITRRKTSKFVLASARASDVELSFLLARFFHEASFRTRAMQSDGEKIARDLNVVMPRELRKSFAPVVKGLKAQALPLRVNATALASATITDACKEIGSLMANISDYNNKLSSMHGSMHDLWQITELMLPKVGNIYPMKPAVVDTVKDMMSMATNQIAGLSEASDEIVTNVGPIVAERLQCT